MEETKQLTWKMTILAAATILAVPAIAPMLSLAVSNYKLKQKYGTIFAETAGKEFGTFNHLCTTILETSIKEKWDDTTKQWTKLCADHDEDYFNRYGK